MGAVVTARFAANFLHISSRDLEHTANRRVKQGVNPRLVPDSLGRADITLTLNTYWYVLSAMQCNRPRSWVKSC